ncbi:excinuclease ABC subunit A [Enterococcus sp. DIV0212c]|uniref:ATP-binding cassette domain-containing protein n=1 Tax=Enterococcus sp. DIV0212c TaxID=2230867 RepID=UPI001A9A99B8|nr:excinuclease ABC subunit UvrA [Enterococcus sp. DIV0212c]MBO1353281.1 excinuclease ABC subunit UvrA [Enterococcus sp. DIV0212c]
MEKEWIKIKNATQNNLKNVTTQIPKHKLTVVTGVSGSGKSSLIFDTLAAESRRELNDTFPSFLQKYLPKYGRPIVESIENLPVAIVIEQKKLSSNSRSTVGTYTDIYTFLRLLFSRVGEPFVGYSDTFSFNHPDGKCPECDGIGTVTTIDIHELVDFNKSLNEGPIDFPTFHAGFWRWKRYADSGLFDLDKKIKDYSQEELELFLYAPQQKLKNPPEKWPHTALFEGLIPRMRRSILQSDEGKRHQKQLDRFITVETCPACRGSRVNERVRSCKISGKSIADVVMFSLDELTSFIEKIDAPLAVDIKPEIQKRLEALIEIGLSYLTLGRSTGSLSGGEAQRIRISKYINSALNDMMYILDEPSAGLHPKDIDRINNALLALKDKGNTVVLVEHNPQLICCADYILDMGPGAGEGGGDLQFAGDYAEFLQSKTITSKALKTEIEIKKNPRKPKSFLEIKNATLHNLKDFSAEIPLGVMTVICGVAGSGKSSLGEIIRQTAVEENHEIVAISQKSIGINLRSTPLTYLDIFGKIRELFAKQNGVSAALFSYNSKGACPRCRGKGVIVSDMAFMEDIVTTCEVCHGTRYDPKVLKYTYKDKTIVDVLEMTVNESSQFFLDQSFKQELLTLLEVGLGYLRLNQSLTTLSGGELQRLKLANQLHKKGTIYLLDEPTDGLHLADIDQLLTLFNQMVNENSSLILLEHHLSMIKQADWIIEIGPEGGTKGGKLMFSGTPEELANSGDLITKPYL